MERELKVRNERQLRYIFHLHEKSKVLDLHHIYREIYKKVEMMHADYEEI